LLEHDDARTLTENEAVAAGVPGAARSCRIVVAGGPRARRRKAADTKRRDACLRPAGHHHVGIAVLDETRGLADAVIARRARADRPEIRPAESVMDRREPTAHG